MSVESRPVTGKFPTESLRQFIPPIAFVVIVLILFPVREQFQFDHDEGGQLMKAMLVAEGYDLYSDIWSDHGPVWTYVLAGIFQVTGYRIVFARLATLLCGAGLVWSAGQFLRVHFSSRAAVVGVVVMALLPLFMVRSISVMIGIPSISLAMLAIFLVGRWHRDRQPAWLVLSAIALSLSIGIKLFTGFLALIIGIGLLIGELAREKERRRWILVPLPAIAWSLIFVATTAAWFFGLVGIENLGQLVSPHLEGAQIDFAGETITQLLAPLWPLFVLAGTGAILAYRRKNALMLYPLAWVVVAYGLLLGHQPVWDHLQLLVTVPAAMLASIGIVEVIDQLPGAEAFAAYLRGKSWRFTLGLVAVALLIFDLHRPTGFELVRRPDPENTGPYVIAPAEARILSEVSNYAPESSWMVSDNLMYPFLTKVKVPPNLAIMSLKRLQTGHLTEREIIQTIETYRPEQVFLSRTEYPAVEAYLDADYTLIREEQFGPRELKLFVRSDLVP